MSRASSSERALTFRLPHRALWFALGAFVLGLGLFGLFWLTNRDDEALYSVQPVDKTAEAALSEPLPEPMAAQDNASGMQSPSASDTQAAADTTASSQPLPKAVDDQTADAGAAPTTQPPAAAQADRPTPLPIEAQSPAPTYPPAALRRGDTGTVVVRIEVDANGDPGGVALIQRSGSRDLDRAAMQAVRRWHFQPAIEDGQPVAGSVDVPVEFNLQH